jgi:DNA-binding transcriptional MerR regulator
MVYLWFHNEIGDDGPVTVGQVSEYRIDDLARAAGVTVRNVRVYQDRGLLQPPRRQGRAAWYNEAHLQRLQLISKLLHSGFTFAHIGNFIEALETGAGVVELLGFKDILAEQWADEIPTHFTRSELASMLGVAEISPEIEKRTTDLQVVAPEGDGFKVLSPSLLRSGFEMMAEGFSLEDVLDISEVLAADMRVLVEHLVDCIVERLFSRRFAGWESQPEELSDIATLVDHLRPIAQKSVNAHFTRSMERFIKEAPYERILGGATSKIEDTGIADQPGPEPRG